MTATENNIRNKLHSSIICMYITFIYVHHIYTKLYSRWEKREIRTDAYKFSRYFHILDSIYRFSEHRYRLLYLFSKISWRKRMERPQELSVLLITKLEINSKLFLKILICINVSYLYFYPFHIYTKISLKNRNL